MEKEYRPLASGIDSLNLAIDLYWLDNFFFDYLSEMKKIAQDRKADQAIFFPDTEQMALIKPYGRKGYEWILENDDFSFTIGNWHSPISRPSILASIRSKALWQIGAQNLVDNIVSILTCAGAGIAAIKTSRVDLCLDIILPAQLWNVDLLPLRVTRAAYAAPHFNNSQLTGISIGKGNTMGRLYDKALEIRQKSQKYWMYDIWKIGLDIPDDIKIIRVEGQFRRETLKEVGLDLIDETLTHIDKLWAYFTLEWLKFQDNPGKHHTMRHTFEWWKVIQNSFLGEQNPTPLIRCKAIVQRKKQLYAQTSGTLTSLLALDHEQQDTPLGSSVCLEDLKNQFSSCFEKYGKSDSELKSDLYQKRAKYHKAKLKMKQTHQERLEQGLPSNLENPIHLHEAQE